MANIPSPNVENDHPDRHLSCQEALEDEFQRVIESAVSAGWAETEATAALLDLSDNHMLSRFANDETDAVLKILKRMT